MDQQCHNAMQEIDNVQINFDANGLLLLNVALALVMFGVALGITINDFKNLFKQPKIILAGMQLPPNMGQDYTSEFKTIFPELAEKNELYLIPFLLKDVGGIPELNQSDGIHPTVEGQKILAKNVWTVLEPIINL